MRLYGYRFTRTGGIAGADRTDDPGDVAAASSFGWPIREVERFTPADVFERSITAASALGEDAVLGAFVAGLGSAAHGRQIVISFAWARHLATAPVDVDGLPDCGLARGRAEGFIRPPHRIRCCVSVCVSVGNHLHEAIERLRRDSSDPAVAPGDFQPLVPVRR